MLPGECLCVGSTATYPRLCQVKRRGKKYSGFKVVLNVNVLARGGVGIECVGVKATERTMINSGHTLKSPKGALKSPGPGASQPRDSGFCVAGLEWSPGMTRFENRLQEILLYSQAASLRSLE